MCGINESPLSDEELWPPRHPIEAVEISDGWAPPASSRQESPREQSGTKRPLVLLSSYATDHEAFTGPRRNPWSSKLQGPTSLPRPSNLQGPTSPPRPSNLQGTTSLPGPSRQNDNSVLNDTKRLIEAAGPDDALGPNVASGTNSPSGAIDEDGPTNSSIWWPCGVHPNESASIEATNFSMACAAEVGARDLARRLVEDLAPSPVEDIAGRVGDLILELTTIRRRSYMEMLRATLCVTPTRLLHQMLDKLTDFRNKYACERCRDLRPPPRPALPPDVQFRSFDLVPASAPSSLGDLSPAKLSHEDLGSTELSDGNLRPLKSFDADLGPTLAPKDASKPSLLLAIAPLGRLGNQMGEYATLLALHKLYNVTVRLTEDMAGNLTQTFPHLSLPTLTEDETPANWTLLAKDGGCAVRRYRGLELAAAGLFGPQQFLISAYPFEMQLFNAYRALLLQDFKFHPKIMRQARARLLNATRAGGVGRVAVGMHIRLSDYPGFMKREFQVEGLLASYGSYLRRATRQILRRFPNASFVVTSDEPENATAILQDLRLDHVVVTNGTAAEDMCLLALCHHRIMTFGTFGFWAGYLGRGTTLYPDLEYPDAPYMLTRARYTHARVTSFIPVPFYPQR
ncbi:uncharacterized protein LOC108666313 [Hyalella azteca]|uniref:L-Fucosyltransferase n=1 Tax=Hyalella azteca TaxID=294128 RepID=A0A8B7N479_HYAAZ|nr:uncharacterized protein LOC108666313 [Hyalella azteca]